jgi:hypothetical protein
MDTETTRAAQYELRFTSLADEDTAWSFPCDAQGRVDMDGLDERLLYRYLYARATRGREFLMPSVQRRGEAPASRRPHRPAAAVE